MSNGFMLCASGGEPDENRFRQLADSDKWVFEPKWDGVRAQARIAGGNVKLVNRNGVDISHRYPEVLAILGQAFDGRQLCLDGELVCFLDGQPDFATIHRRDAQSNDFAITRLSRTLPATFVAFDLLDQDGTDLRQRTLEERLGLLQLLVNTDSWSELTRSIASRDGLGMWAQIVARDWEGMVAKRLASTYRPGRSTSWVKFKRTQRLVACVRSATAGQGARANTFGALRLVLADGTREGVDIGEVGSGFTEALVAECQLYLDTDRELVVEVEYTQVSKGGKLRNPVFRGIRTDLSAADCTINQLRGD